MRTGLAAAAALAVLAGCGGGGGGSPQADDSQETATEYPVRQAFESFLRAGGSVSASRDGWTIRQRVTPLSPRSFLGRPEMNATQSEVSLYQGNSYYSTVSNVTYFLSGDENVLYGHEQQTAAGVQRAVYDIDAPLPEQAKAGDSGPFLTWVATDQVSHQPIEWTRVTWSLVGETQDRSMLCLHFTETRVSSGQATTESDCYRIDPAGRVSGASFTATVNGQEWTFR